MSEVKKDIPLCQNECLEGEAPVCGEFNAEGFGCTRLLGHSGFHVACGYVKHAYAVWENIIEKGE
jgi:hypothetical protein